MWIEWILLNIRLGKSDKVAMTSSKSNKTEKILKVLYYISRSFEHKINTSKLKELLDHPSKANFYKLRDELVGGMGELPPLLLEEENPDQTSEPIYKLNSKAWDNFVTASQEGHFYLEAFRKLSSILNSDYTRMHFDDLEGEAKAFKNLDRKFYYVNKAMVKNDEVFAKKVNQIVNALLSNNRMKISYTRPGDQFEYERVIEPLTLCQHRDDLYLLCYKVEGSQKEVRNYKVSRIGDITPLDEKFNYPTTLKWNPAREFEKNSGIFITNEQGLATFRVYGHARHVFSEKNIFDSVLIEQTQDYDQYQCHYGNPNEFIGQLFIYADEIEIIAPSQIKQQFLKKAQSVLNRHEVKSKKKSA
jgi:hypothetical protein